MNTLVTLAVYRLLRPQVGSGTATLAVAAAVPVSWTAARTRRVE